MSLTPSRVAWTLAPILVSAATTPSLAQSVNSSAKLSDDGSMATRLADVVYVNAQNLVLLQVFNSTTDITRLKRAKQVISSAMTQLDALATDSFVKAKAGALPSAVAQFVNEEMVAARAVVRTQEAALSIRDEEAKPTLLAMGAYSRVLNKLYGKVPGPSGTPDFFYLGLLTWARKGLPPIRQDAKIDSVFSPLEAYRSNLKQLDDPSHEVSSKRIGSKDKNIIMNAAELKSNATQRGH